MCMLVFEVSLKEAIQTSVIKFFIIYFPISYTLLSIRVSFSSIL